MFSQGFKTEFGREFLRVPEARKVRHYYSIVLSQDRPVKTPTERRRGPAVKKHNRFTITSVDVENINSINIDLRTQLKMFAPTNQPNQIYGSTI